RIAINDLSRPVCEFWKAVLHRTEEFTSLICETSVNMTTRMRAKRVLMRNDASGLELAFAAFFLNRTNRSGIMNGGAIGGNDQRGPWKLDARYNKEDLIHRINKIATMRKRIIVTNYDALEFLANFDFKRPERTLVYLDPPYYKKGLDLYYDFYKHDDHVRVAKAAWSLGQVRWIVSYDDVAEVSRLYARAASLRYTVGYSARERSRGTEAMFFSPGLSMPPVRGSMAEVSRSEIGWSVAHANRNSGARAWPPTSK
ncbi:MAG: DNA adenine methylase, partial [Alphaproteobacteria bacterium]|nr:DNA adenine methylase [Alphaproteobacteria bacterium]